MSFSKSSGRAKNKDKKVEDHEATVTKLNSIVAKQGLLITQQQKQIEVLTAAVQKVSDRLELNKTAPQVVASDQ